MTPPPNAARARPKPRPPADPRDAAEALGYDTGSRAIPVDVEHIAVGTRSTMPRARRADPLARVACCTPGMRAAAAIYRQALEHVQAGRGMGPLPLAAERVQNGRGGGLLAQEAALTAAVWYRRGVQAMGLAAAQGVVQWVVIAGLPLEDYDATRRWRRHTSRAQLVAALERLAVAYDCA